VAATCALVEWPASQVRVEDAGGSPKALGDRRQDKQVGGVQRLWEHAVRAAPGKSTCAAWMHRSVIALCE